MRAFAEALDDGWPRDMLLAALEGPPPTSRFEDALGFFPEDRLRWVACRDARLAAVVRGLARGQRHRGPPASRRDDTAAC